MDETERRIIEAAIKVFSEKGFVGASTRDIADTAGVNEVTLFRRFGSKKNILHHIIHQAVEIYGYHVVVEPVAKIFEEKDLTIRQRLINLLKNRYKLIMKHFPLLKIMLQESSLNTEIRNLFFEKVIMKAIKVAEVFMAEGIQSGYIREDIDPMTALRSLMGSLVFLILQQNFFIKLTEKEVEQEIEKIVDIFLYGISK